MGVVNATPQPLYARERHGTHCIGGWLGIRAGLDGCGKSHLPPEFDPCTFQPVARRYADWANPAYSYVVLTNNKTEMCWYGWWDFGNNREDQTHLEVNRHYNFLCLSLPRQYATPYILVVSYFNKVPEKLLQWNWKTDIYFGTCCVILSRKVIYGHIYVPLTRHN